jgi:TonB family protein
MRLRNFLKWLVLSICLHLILMGIVLIYNVQFPAPTKPNTIAVEFIETPPTGTKTRIKPLVLKNQIVEQDEKNKTEEAPDTRFLSAKNQKVEKQTVAKNRGEFKNAGKELKKKAGEKSKPSLQDLTPDFNPLAIKEQQQQKELGHAGRDAKGGETSQSNDYLKDIETGNETVLNSREFKYFTYYSRIRRQLSQHWEPKVKEKMSRMFKQGRKIASDQDHITKLLIFLNERGQLVKVQVLGESGVRDLDDAATDAFRSAAPFPNPPRGIIEADGMVKIRWDFVLES